MRKQRLASGLLKAHFAEQYAARTESGRCMGEQSADEGHAVVA